MAAGDRSPIIRALAGLSSVTSADIRVHLSRRWIEMDPLKRGKKLFRKFCAPQTPSVLIYANLRRRKFAIVADTSSLDAAGENYFRQLATLLEEDLHSTNPELAIAVCIRTLSSTLAAHFPVIPSGGPDG